MYGTKPLLVTYIEFYQLLVCYIPCGCQNIVPEAQINARSFQVMNIRKSGD